MKLVAIAVSAVLLAGVLNGCANVQPPVDVRLIPDDCSNQPRIISWLESQVQAVSANSNPDYQQYHAQIKNRIWLLRYRCNPA